MREKLVRKYGPELDSLDEKTVGILAVIDRWCVKDLGDDFFSLPETNLDECLDSLYCLVDIETSAGEASGFMFCRSLESYVGGILEPFVERPSLASRFLCVMDYVYSTAISEFYVDRRVLSYLFSGEYYFTKLAGDSLCSARDILSEVSKDYVESVFALVEKAAFEASWVYRFKVEIKKIREVYK